jgi:hypothetical protein
MHIELPATLTADYEPTIAEEYPFERAGVVVIKFGRGVVVKIPVTEEQHDRLDVEGFYSAHTERATALEELVAGWLKERLTK